MHKDESIGYYNRKIKDTTKETKKLEQRERKLFKDLRSTRNQEQEAFDMLRLTLMDSPTKKRAQFRLN